MDVLQQHCVTARRRQEVLANTDVVGGLELNGIDFLEVLDQDAPSEEMRQRLIDLVFLKPDGVLDNTDQPEFTPDMIVIEGGTRIRSVRVTDVVAGTDPDKKTLRLRLDRAGDFSPYSLRLRTSATDDAPPERMDPVLSRITFSFKADCPTAFDCQPPEAPPRRPERAPPLDYLAKDYESFRRLMLDRMATTMPAWTERSPADLGVTLVEALSYAADQASYHQDAVATEAYLSHARRRESVRRHARLLAYRPNEGTNTRAWVAIQAQLDVPSGEDPVLDPGTLMLTRVPEEASGAHPAALRPNPELLGKLVNAGAMVFETMEPVKSLRVDRNEIAFHTWAEEDCCLPIGTTRAHLVDTAGGLELSKGDVLILEERTPRGGTPADPSDPEHRQAVRLAKEPVSNTDPLDGTKVLEVQWHEEDALQFPLNLVGAVAHGNVVLVDHGRTLDYHFANTKSEAVVSASIHADLLKRPGLIPEVQPSTGPYEPQLARPNVTRAEPFDAKEARDASAAAATKQRAEEALPAVKLIGGGETWLARGDLLASDRFASEFVVETANDGTAFVRFGDGRFGRRPAKDTTLRPRMRIGNGPAGRIGAGAIGHVVTDTPDRIAGVTNPLPSVGGEAPESLTTVKINAPFSFRRQKRAVTDADYADFAQRHPLVQRAVAERRWTGSWHTTFVAVDPVAGQTVDDKFKATLRAHLEPYRLAGHDLEIEKPNEVPLDIALAVCVAPGHYAAHVEQALLTRFGDGWLPDGERAFFHPDLFTFGTPVRLSRIVAAAMDVPGVQWIGLRLDGLPEEGHFRKLRDAHTDFGDSGVIPIGPREVARLDNDPDEPENGRLRFIMEGGR